MSDSNENVDGVYSLSMGDGESGTRDAWLKALEELGTPSPPVHAKAVSADVEAERKTREAEKLCDETREKIMVAISSLDAFSKMHPYLIAPNVYQMWKENMREIVVTMDRERTRSKVEQL